MINYVNSPFTTLNSKLWHIISKIKQTIKNDYFFLTFVELYTKNNMSRLSYFGKKVELKKL